MAAEQGWDERAMSGEIARLRASEEQFRTLAENMPSICWLGGADGRPYWLNRLGRQFHGLGPSDRVSELDIAAVVHPDEYPELMRRWRRALATGDPLEMTVCLRTQDGGFRPFLSRAEPVRDADGAVIRWCGVETDVSARHELDRRQQLLRGFTEATRDMTDASAILATLGEMLIEHMGIGQITYSEVTDGDPKAFNVFLARPGRRFDEVPEMFRFDEGFEALMAHYANGRTFVVEDWDEDLPELTEPVRAARRAVAMRAAITVPLVKDGRLVAMLSAVDPVARRWTGPEVELVEELAERVWASVSRARAEARLKERERSQAFLIDWSDRVRGEKSPRAILGITLDRLGAFLGASRVNYGEVDAEGTRFDVLHEWRDDGTGSVVGYAFPFAAIGASMHAAHVVGEPIVVADIQHHPLFDARTMPLYQSIGLAALLNIPMVREGRLEAALSIQQTRPRRWTPAEVQLARDVADRTAAVLERARAEEELLERERNQAFLIAWSDGARGQANPRAILADTLDRVGRHLGVSRANYAEGDAAGTSLRVLQEWCDGSVSVVGQAFPLAALGERIVADHLTGEPVAVADIAADARMDEANRPTYESIGVAAFLSLPMVRDGRIEAVLSVQQDTPRGWTAKEVQLLRDVADRSWAILERARSEERMAASEALLATFMENAPVVMHLKDAAGRYVRINPEFARALGRPVEELLGRHPDELFPPDLARAIDAIEQRALAGEVASAELSVGPDDSYGTVLSTVFPIRGPVGEACTAGVTVDITERKRAEAALARGRDVLYQSEKLSALGSLLAGVSHELNNPLSIVVAQAVMMERQAGGTELADRAARIRRAADRCARIVQTFLAMARQKQPERLPVDLDAVAAAALDLTGYGLRTSGIAVERRFAPGLPRIAADADQLHQIVVNLLVNAQAAMSNVPGEHRLTVTVARGPEPETLVLDVADTGPGVPEPLRRRVFDPFFTTKPQGEGTGIGLSFSQGLAEAHGGRLALLPSASGALFRLTLPVDPGLTLPPVAPADPVPAPARPRRALVVDDEAEIAESLADFLSLEGFACEVAVGGAAARARLASGDWDLIVSDLRMPDVDGPDLYRWLLHERPELSGRMAFATGDTLGVAAARFLAEAKRPVLEKPFMPDAVRRFVEQIAAG